PPGVVPLGDRTGDPVRGAPGRSAPPPRLARARGLDRARRRDPRRHVRTPVEGAALRVPHARHSETGAPARRPALSARVGPVLPRRAALPARESRRRMRRRLTGPRVPNKEVSMKRSLLLRFATALVALAALAFAEGLAAQTSSKPPAKSATGDGASVDAILAA